MAGGGRFSAFALSAAKICIDAASFFWMMAATPRWTDL
jgi:hypothetical protein